MSSRDPPIRVHPIPIRVDPCSNRKRSKEAFGGLYGNLEKEGQLQLPLGWLFPRAALILAFPMDPIPGLEQAVDAFVKARGSAPDDKTPIVSRPDLTKLVGPLTNAYWARALQIVTDTVKRGGDQLIFNKYERLTIDLGLIDAQLVPDFESARTDILRELYARADSTHFYFSEWLAHRYRTFALTDQMETAASGGDTRRIALATQAQDPEVQQFQLARSRIYALLRGLFENLPGFPPQTVEMLFTGQMDVTIEELGMSLARRPDPRTADQRRHLMNMRQRMVARARERAAADDERTYFDGLKKLDGLLEAKMLKAIEDARSSHDSRVVKGSTRVSDSKDPGKRIDFLKSELNLVKSLLRLGVMGAGVTRTTPVLFSVTGRAKKGELRAALEAVRECDPALPGTPNMLVAPYIGTGFYEWDRDTVFVPLTPTRGVEEAIVTALANYRFMLDNLQGKGGLKRAYHIKFDKEDFRTGFIRDYKNWVLGVGKGFKGRMSDDAYEFFKSYIGPSTDDLFAPADLARISPEQRGELIKECRGRLNRAEGTYEDHHKLAVLYWKENRLQDALENIAAAVKLYPVDGRMMYSLGHVCVAVGYDAKAKEAFNEVLNIAPNTIWHIYASDALQRLA